MEFAEKELENNLNGQNNDLATNESQIEERKNTSLQNISILGISIEKVKRVSEAYDNCAEDDKIEEEENESSQPSRKFSEFFSNLTANDM